MSENIDINVGIIKEEISINAANNIVEVNISTAPVTVINPQNYDLSQFTNTSPNPFIQQSSLSSYVPISRIITINGVAQDLSTDRSWTISVPSITGLVPYIGANANVNLGEYGLTAGQLTLDTSPTGTAVVGTTRWNNTIGSSETTLKGGSVILKNGVDLVARIVNKVTPNATLTKANYTAVRVSGAQGQRLAVAYAQANNDANSADTLGLVTETIPTNQEGFIITVGQLEGINTTGSLQGESWSDGDVLYLSPTTPGAITNIKPSGITGHIIVIGYVEYAHANNGKIYVKIMNGWELDELHNVYIDPLTLANNNILQYDSSTQLWRNQVLNTGITIGTTAITSGTVGRVLFEGTGNVVQESANITWDNTNAVFSLGTLATKIINFKPADTSSIFGNTSSIRGGVSGRIDFLNGSNLTHIYDGTVIVGPTAGPYIQVGSTSIAFAIGGTERMRIAPTTGNVGINTTTDAGFRLDVNGTARVASTVGQTLLVQSSLDSSFTSIAEFNASALSTSRTGFIAIGRNAATNNQASLGFFYAGNGSNANRLDFGFFGTASRMSIFAGGNIGINTTTDAGFRLDVNGTARIDQTLQLNATGTGTLIAMGGNIGRFTIDGLFIRFKVTGGGDILNMTTNFFGVNETAVIPSAICAMTSTNRGFLPPRMTTTQKNAIASPATGLQIFDTTLNRPCFYDGTTWITL